VGIAHHPLLAAGTAIDVELSILLDALRTRRHNDDGKENLTSCIARFRN